jgi:hypothetical protein
MSYAVVVSRVTMENRTTELLILAVHRDLSLEDAMRLLGARAAGTVGRIQRLPVDLPEIGDVLRLDAENRWPGAPATNSMAARRERRQRALGGKP